MRKNVLFEELTASEMMKVRGGGETIKSNPPRLIVEYYDNEDGTFTKSREVRREN